MESGCGGEVTTAQEKFCCTIPTEPLACTVNLKLPEKDGVPESRPEELIETFPGNPPNNDHVHPVPHPGAPNCRLKALPTVPCGRMPPVVIANAFTSILTPKKVLSEVLRSVTTNCALYRPGVVGVP